MSRFQPFPGFRYDEQIAPLAEAIAPPYDVVSELDRQVLAERSPYNAIHVELPVPDPEKNQDRYAHAAAIFSKWETEGAIRRDDVPSFYVYRMTFHTETGDRRSTTGVLGALAIDKPGGSSVLPHEQTMPKPKGDRLDLLRACKANLSPIWGLSLAPGLAAACVNATANSPAPMSATDDDGVLHELWPVDDSEAVASIAALVDSTPIVVADGHHRYETAIFYQQEQREANGQKPGVFDYVMALVVELSPNELFVQAIHRLVTGLPDDFDIVSAMEPFFRVEKAPDDADAVALALQPRGALGLLTRNGNYFLAPLASLVEQAEADLDSSRLDVVLAALPAHELTYQHGVRHVYDAVADKTAQIGFLIRPATVEQIADTAHSGHRMPPKTTFFQPKPRTGMVFRSVAN